MATEKTTDNENSENQTYKIGDLVVMKKNCYMLEKYYFSNKHLNKTIRESDYRLLGQNTIFMIERIHAYGFYDVICLKGEYLFKKFVILNKNFEKVSKKLNK